ncbi:hypothetical protein HanXRQr2_Chr07g0310341 [Helianthus annuus]|uniref:Uncharacterized protein n=1 Tax=Helianthus annuus TaxID=4232 RepID=A0A251UFV3_HELAN|nr:uncharacterized protein LOC110868831 [Helianthus annuus]KAF5799947.1 hypothetical protein HanXRQr2_Chr07g0310341 [Helianthus annuus]KAJ0551332.1 hypothetical protein HanHA300_Chr07g0255931 [Helianthus annuus]KAJ0729622.1 hypothetical protein HanLR1_Chr07g0254981 [Helianthus annuus]KAJ0732364.1 hypothetical protein HanOQP8_Chr07g0262351 [Helianthus annuus]
MSTSFNSNPRSPATSSRLQLGGVGGVSRAIRSSSSKKPPEPLRRAIADCLSSSLISVHGSSSAVISEASRTLRDYLASHATTDLAYGVIIEHTLAERERSPAVVARCVALLKRYLLRYKPSEETLLEIDRFCLNIITECDISPSRRLTSRSVTPQTAGSSTTLNGSPLPVASFASGGLVKSLNYIRSLVAQHVPRRPFQPAAFAGATPASRQSLPSLSSLMSKSFNSQISPGIGKEASEIKEGSAVSVLDLPIAEDVSGIEGDEFIASDVFKWRWHGDPQSSLLSSDSDRPLNHKDMSKHNFLEVGAAALLLGDMEAKTKGEFWRNFGSVDMPYLDQLLQPSLLTTVTNSASARSHLRAITASKRSKTDPHQIWEDSPMTTFRPRSRPLFQYRHYSEQQPLKLNSVEVGEVIAAVCSEKPPITNVMTISSKLTSSSGKPSMDVAVSVLIKLVIDMYVLDSGVAAPLMLSMLEEMLSSSQLTSKVRVFDVILNLGVHGHLLEPILADDASTIEEEYAQEPLSIQGTRKPDYLKAQSLSAINNFESWILCILYEVLLLLVQREEKDESVWASALSCLLYFVCDRGKIRRSRLKGLDIRVIKVLIQISRRNSWAELVHCKLINMLTNMFYDVSEGSTTSTPIFLVDQVHLIGGIEFVFIELVISNSREGRRNLYLVLFDYVVHEINESCVANGISEYSNDEIQPIASLLTLADAPEALHISVKLGIEGIGDILKRSISAALPRYSNSERLNTLLEKIMEKFDALLRSLTHLDKEFSHMTELTKSYKYLESFEDGVLRNSYGLKVKLAWATLHSLLHSERAAIRENGYVWLGDLLIAEINDDGDSIWSNIKNLQKRITLASVKDYSPELDIPLPIWLMCGLLKSKNNLIRWGFLFVLERLLMRCKFLLDENELQHSVSSETHGKTRLDKANAVIDIMSSALSLVAQINVTDRMNILKMCDILFSQLCLKVIPGNKSSSTDTLRNSKSFNYSVWNKKTSLMEDLPVRENFSWEPSAETSKGGFGINANNPTSETASMAALLLQGQAIVPMQLVARVPAILFYWPLIQLAAAATDNIALGVSVGSKGGGNLPGATSDIRSTLLLLLIGKCTADPAAFKEVGGEDFFRELLDDTDSRVAYFSSTFLLKRMMTEEADNYQRGLSSLVSRAQQSNNEKLLENPYLQMRGLLQLSSEGLWN